MSNSSVSMTSLANVEIVSRSRRNIKSSLHRDAKHGRIGSMSDLPDELPSDPVELRAFAAVLLDRCARLERLLKLANDARFGRSSEKLDADQLQPTRVLSATGFEARACVSNPCRPEAQTVARRSSA